MGDEGRRDVGGSGQRRGLMPGALLFDLDGTLLDSDPLHIAVFADMLRSRDIAVDKFYYLKHIHGRLNVDVFAELMPDQDPSAMDVAKEAEFRRRLAETNMPPARALWRYWNAPKRPACPARL